jgi:hypothetical protein
MRLRCIITAVQHRRHRRGAAAAETGRCGLRLRHRGMRHVVVVLMVSQPQKPSARAAAKQLRVLGDTDAPCVVTSAQRSAAALLARAAQGESPLETPRSHRAGGAPSSRRSPRAPAFRPVDPAVPAHFPTRRPRRIYTATSESGAAPTLGAPRGERSRLPPSVEVAVPSSNYKNSRPERAGRTKTTNLIYHRLRRSSSSSTAAGGAGDNIDDD